MFNNSIMALQVATIMLFVLALRLKLWQKSGTTFMVLCLMFGLLVFRNIAGPDAYVQYHPLVLVIFLFIITTRAVAKERTDKLLGDWHKHDRRHTDVKHTKA